MEKITQADYERKLEENFGPRKHPKLTPRQYAQKIENKFGPDAKVNWMNVSELLELYRRLEEVEADLALYRACQQPDYGDLAPDQDITPEG